MWSLYLCGLSLSFRFNTFGLFLCWILGHHFFFRLQYTLTVYRLEIPFILGKLVYLNICSVPLFWLCSFRNLKPLCCLLCILLFCLSSILLFLQWIPSLLLSLFSWSFFASVFLFFFSVFFFICWNTVALVSAVQLSESTMYINVSTASWTSLPLLGVSSLSHHRAQSWAPYVRSTFPLAICFTRGSVYVSNLISQFIPPTTVSTCPFSTSASLV